MYVIIAVIDRNILWCRPITTNHGMCRAAKVLTTYRLLQARSAYKQYPSSQTTLNKALHFNKFLLNGSLTENLHMPHEAHMSIDTYK